MSHMVAVATSSFEIQQHPPSFSHIQARNLATEDQLAGAPSVQDTILVVILFSSSSSPKVNVAKCHHHPVDRSDLSRKMHF